jgi:hypothetical protein
LQDVAFFVALLATALALGGALAHALELPNKIEMVREHYFIRIVAPPVSLKANRARCDWFRNRSHRAAVSRPTL